MTTARGLEPAMAYYGLLDRTPNGRDEDAAEPLWVRRHDEYGTVEALAGKANAWPRPSPGGHSSRWERSIQAFARCLPPMSNGRWR